MAGWNDLPTEIKEMVVDMVDDTELVRSGEVSSGDETFDAMLALSATDRELHDLAAPIIWRTVNLEGLSLARVESFKDNVAASKGQCVRELRLRQSDTRSSNPPTVIEIYASLLSHLVELERLHLSCGSTDAIGLLPLLHPSLPRTLRHLTLRGWNFRDSIDSATAAAVISAFPELVSLELVGIRQGKTSGAALAVTALRSLKKLQKLRIDYGDGFNDPSLGSPWSSSLLALDVGDLEGTPLPLFQALLERHASTLQKLVVPFYLQDAIFPPFPLPRLHTLSLSLNTESAALPRSFQTSPVRELIVEMYDEFGEVKEMVEEVVGTVQEHRGTLKEVSLAAYSYEIAGDADQGALDELEELCRKEEIVYRFKLRYP